MAARHILAVLGGLVSYAWRTRSPGVLLLVLVGSTVAVVTVATQVIGPVALYPFL